MSMAAILIKDIPADLHERLREAAVRDHRSLSKEVIALLEAALAERVPELPPPIAAARISVNAIGSTRKKTNSDLSENPILKSSHAIDNSLRIGILLLSVLPAEEEGRQAEQDDRHDQQPCGGHAERRPGAHR
ncbi:MAG: hypothetical protein HGA19_23515, partial [Oscillochloris sp.]|nr:hypothetical protein [Oscillochloris sp.]